MQPNDSGLKPGFFLYVYLPPATESALLEADAEEWKMNHARMNHGWCGCFFEDDITSHQLSVRVNQSTIRRRGMEHESHGRRIMWMGFNNGYGQMMLLLCRWHQCTSFFTLRIRLIPAASCYRSKWSITAIPAVSVMMTSVHRLMIIVSFPRTAVSF